MPLSSQRVLQFYATHSSIHLYTQSVEAAVYGANLHIGCSSDFSKLGSISLNRNLSLRQNTVVLLFCIHVLSVVLPFWGALSPQVKEGGESCTVTHMQEQSMSCSFSLSTVQRNPPLLSSVDFFIISRFNFLPQITEPFLSHTNQSDSIQLYSYTLGTREDSWATCSFRRRKAHNYTFI